eukprot:1079494-Prymnesium_polylepis.1
MSSVVAFTIATASASVIGEVSGTPPHADLSIVSLRLSVERASVRGATEASVVIRTLRLRTRLRSSS